ncbi:MAG: aminotransferase class I/II-fold pyridoxal phosphate-dependent enzyme [Alphaproteobacteria bacterium]|nr:aminotransferase class I/II-fold pyridoxal phosphate-dependent enzyme [Alphaproteobacteria bacterium]
MADLFDKFDPMIKARDALGFEAASPIDVVMEEILSPTEAVIKGQRTILAGTNNYLGLTFDPRCVRAAHEALDAAGTGTTGSRVLNGTYSGHKALEAAIAGLYGTEHCLVFSTGFLANLASIGTLAGKDDVIVIDADSHASIYDACTMSGATIVRFKHNDPDDLDKRLRRLGGDARVLVVIEGLYSMLGDKAPMRELVEVKNCHGAALMVDEAHSIGVFGETGCGVAQEAGVMDQVEFMVGTFSKSVGTIGGYCVSNHPKFEILRLAARPYMFTASLPPSVVASALKAVEILGSEPQHRQKLWRNARQLHEGLSAAGFSLGAPASPVVAVKIPERATAVRLWEQLLQNGVYVNLAMPPATPQGLNLLRCSLSAAHTPEQVSTIVETFTRLARSNSVLAGSAA